MSVIVVATADFERYHEAVTALRERGVAFTTVDPEMINAGDELPERVTVVLTTREDRIREEVEDAADPLVRIGDGARLQGAQTVNDFPDVAVELADETGTTPYLGAGARGIGDVLAAANIARLKGERVDSIEIDPTEGELQRIKNESRRRSAGGRTISEPLARRVAHGELTVDEALSEHETKSESTSGEHKSSDGPSSGNGDRDT